MRVSSAARPAGAALAVLALTVVLASLMRSHRPGRDGRLHPGSVRVADAVEISYLAGGSGPPVVLLHGHPQTAASWRRVLPRLLDHHRVVVVEQRGQGRSTAPPGGYDAATRAADVAVVLRTLRLGPAAVVGADLGGQVAFSLARDFPDLVSRLAVLEAVVPGTSAAAGPLSDDHIRRNADVATMTRLVTGHELAYVEHFACGDRSPCPYPRGILQASAQALRGPDHLRAAFAPYAALASDALTNRRARAEGRLVRVPVLAAGGQHGIGDLPAASLSEVAGDVTGAVVPAGNHWLAEEYPDALLRVLLPFVDKPSSASFTGAARLPPRRPRGSRAQSTTVLRPPVGVPHTDMAIILRWSSA